MRTTHLKDLMDDDYDVTEFSADEEEECACLEIRFKVGSWVSLDTKMALELAEVLVNFAEMNEGE